MPLFHYEGLLSQGKKSKGVIEASGRKEACDKLREQGIMVTTLSSKEGLLGSGQIRGEQLLTFTVQLSQLVGAGVPLYESLLTLEEQYREEKYHHVVVSLCEQVKEGTALSEAMALYPKSFDQLYTSLIAAGEASGALAGMLGRLEALLRKQNRLRKQMMTAMIYPALLAGFTLVVVILLLTFVIPSIEEIFAGRDVNAYTQMVLSISHIIKGYWYLFVLVIGALVGYLWVKMRDPAWIAWRDKIVLSVPVIKDVVIQSSLARLMRVMSTLLQGGVTLIDALRLSRNTMGNVVLQRECERAEEKIVEGSSFSAQLKASPMMPRMVARMLAVGEDSGDVTTMMAQIADMYEEEVEKTLSRLTALAQPVILLVLGTIVGLVLLAVLLPFTDISSLGG